MARIDAVSLEAYGRLVGNMETFSAHCLKIADKLGKTEPFVWNKAQHYIHAKLEEQKARTGKVRAIILKGRQQGCCLDPDTKVLTADLEWIRIGDVQPGRELVAVDEETSSLAPGSGGGRGRKMRTSTVEAVVQAREPSYKVTLDDGRQIITSGKHRWLVRKSATQWKWRSIDGVAADKRDAIKVGDKFRSVTSPWGAATFDDAWFGGMIDGEGSMDQSPSRSGIRLAVSQRAGAVLDKMESHCRKRGWGHYIVSDDGPRKTKYGRQAVHAVNISNIGSMFEVMGRCRPVRFVSRRWWEGKSMPDSGERVVVSIEPLGVRDVVDIQTSTGTFLAEGLVSHNSTYVAGRFYHHTSTNKGQKALIVGHEQKSTDSLFGMVKRYHESNPLAPATGSTNAKELVFSKLGGGYKLATAGTQDVGRGNTAQVAHLSEFAFWANAQLHMAGLGNTIADMPGTEVIIESTANGLGNAYHLMWQAAEAGQGDYIAIFVPWYWQDEYRAPVKEDFELSGQDKAYMEAYGLDMEQMQWRANKIASYGQGFEYLFPQEYPATPAEAFQSSTTNPLVNPNYVMAAVNSAYRFFQGPLLIGCDPAGDGVADPDRTAIAFRQGRVVKRVEFHTGLDTMQIAGKLAAYCREFSPAAIFVDKGGLGAGVVDRLNELGMPVIGVNSATAANDPERYENKRAEMWWLMAEWFADQPCRIPNNAALISDLTSPQPKVSSNGRKLLEKKEDMKKRGLRSPDGADAVALTFAQPIASREAHEVFTSPHATRAPVTRSGY